MHESSGGEGMDRKNMYQMMLFAVVPSLTFYHALQSLQILNHPHVMKLKEVVRENNELFFIFEYMVWYQFLHILCCFWL